MDVFIFLKASCVKQPWLQFRQISYGATVDVLGP